jgi:hypothetical protein
MENKGMYKTQCSGCGKDMYTYAKDKLGTIPKVYCSKVCEGKDKYNRRFK